MFRHGILLKLIWAVAALQGWLIKLYGEDDLDSRRHPERHEVGHERPFRDIWRSRE